MFGEGDEQQQQQRKQWGGRKVREGWLVLPLCLFGGMHLDTHQLSCSPILLIDTCRFLLQYI